MKLIFLLLSIFCIVHSRENDMPKPPFWKKAETARWLAHESLWGSIASTSIHLNGIAWCQPISFVDGTTHNSTGNLYFYATEMDVTIQDSIKNPSVSFSLSLAEQGQCTVDKLDPEDPRCVRLVFSGQLSQVEEGDELQFATTALFERHPAMKTWPVDHNWHVYKINITDIWLIDIYGGGSIVTVEEYYDVKYPLIE